MLIKMSTTASVGKFELARSIVLPLTIIIMMQLRVVQATDTQQEYSFADYLGTRLTMTVLGLVLLTVIAFGCYGGEVAWVILLWGLAKSIECVSDIVRGLFQKYECMNFSGISMAIAGSAGIMAAGMLLWSTGKIILAITGIIAVHITVLFLYELPHARRLLCHKSASDGKTYRMRPHFHIITMFTLLWLALPLGIVNFLGALQSTIPKLILESYHGEIALGYFGPIAYPISLGTIIVYAMGWSALPRLANYYNNDLVAYCRLMKKLLFLGLSMGVLLIAAVAVFGKFLLTFLYSSEYARYHTDFIILAVSGAIGFVSTFCVYGLTSARIFKLQLLVPLMSCLVAVITAILIVPSYGLRGTTITSIISFSTMLVCAGGILLWIIHKRRKGLEL
ncbi:MAG: hypothetical protein JXB29_10165 [Sedimentisphaerales bacterium]|nr:hypothetical protein [Sedimentisphaerales bacterium]